jgi:hypothetical protein
LANEVTIPALPCRDLEVSIAFYEALGFVRSFRQQRPNPYAVVSRDDFHLHLFTIDGFEPEQSYATVIVVVPDADKLYEAFAAACGPPTASCRRQASLESCVLARKKALSGASASSTRAATGYASPSTAIPRTRRPKTEAQAWPV